MDQYYKQYPIGSRWLLPVTVAAHLEPDHDDYDPRPIKFTYTADAAPVYPRVRDLKHLIRDTELAPYYVQDLLHGWAIYKTTPAEYEEVCIYWAESHPNAKAAAESECARLNNEHRKEQK